MQLEVVHGLQNRLSSAMAGVVAWPPYPANGADGYVLNWRIIGIPLLAGGLFLMAAHWVPLSRGGASGRTGEISEPPGLTQVQEWADSLKAQDLIEPEKLQEMQSEIDKLRQQSPEDWYTHGNLEAVDSLRQLAGQSLNSLAVNLDAASQQLKSLSETGESSPSGAALEPMRDEFRQTTDKLASGMLPLKREMLDRMRQYGTSGDKALTPEQLKALQEKLEKGKAMACTACQKAGGFGDEMKALLEAEKRGECVSVMMRPGGTGGGKQSAPLALNDRDDASAEGKKTKIESEDMSRATLDDTMNVSAGEHKVDKADHATLQPAGTATVQGDGGEAVWRSSYDPRESDVLMRFFK